MNEGTQVILNDQLIFIIALGYSALGFSFYYFLAKGYRPARLFSGLVADPQARAVLVQRLYGLLFLGLLPLILILLLPDRRLASYGLEFQFAAAPPAWAWLLFALIPLLAAQSVRGSGKQATGLRAMYPQMRFSSWTPQRLVLSLGSWILFLVGYEFLFRGFLLFASLKVLDPLSAIVLNTALYSLAHIYKGPGETFGSIPVGFLLCYLSMETGNIGMALGLHVVMALSNELFAIRANPEMSFSTRP